MPEDQEFCDETPDYTRWTEQHLRDNYTIMVEISELVYNALENAEHHFTVLAAVHFVIEVTRRFVEKADREQLLEVFQDIEQQAVSCFTKDASDFQQYEMPFKNILRGTPKDGPSH